MGNPLIFKWCFFTHIFLAFTANSYHSTHLQKKSKSPSGRYLIAKYTATAQNTAENSPPQRKPRAGARGSVSYRLFSMLSTIRKHFPLVKKYLHLFLLLLERISYMLGIMEKQIEKLIAHYGSKAEAAKVLKITVRHLENCQKGKHVGKPLAELIRFYSNMVP